MWDEMTVFFLIKFDGILVQIKREKLRNCLLNAGHSKSLIVLAMKLKNAIFFPPFLIGSRCNFKKWFRKAYNCVEMIF